MPQWTESAEDRRRVWTVPPPGLTPRSSFLLLWVLSWTAINGYLIYGVVVRLTSDPAYLGPPSPLITGMLVLVETIVLGVWLASFPLMLQSLFLTERLVAQDGQLTCTRSVLGLKSTETFDLRPETGDKNQPTWHVTSTPKELLFILDARDGRSKRVALGDHLDRPARDRLAARLKETLAEQLQ